MTYGVPKLVLVSRVQALLHSGRLKINKNLPEAKALADELQSFRAEVSENGYWRFAGSGNTHDDMVLAIAIALWRSHGETVPIIEHYRRMVEGQRAAQGAALVPALSR